MNQKSNISFGNFPAVFGGLALTAMLAFTGCATKTADDSATSAVKLPPHVEIITLREGDSVKITFPGSPNLDTTQSIRRDGKIQLSLVGDVDAAGLTPDELKDKLLKLYASQITSKEIVVALESSSFPVYVTGAVIHPGTITSDHPITALQAIMEAGGFDLTTANMKSVKIIRNENGLMKHYVVNLKAVLDGSSDKTFYMKPEDIIYVSERFQPF